MNKWFNIAFVGCKCRFMISKEEGMERKKGMKMRKREWGRGWKNKLLIEHGDGCLPCKR